MKPFFFGFVKCQSEYQRGVSAWNFDVKDLKTQASLVSSFSKDDLLLQKTKPFGSYILFFVCVNS